jgi:leucyl aminopeptidase
MRLTTTVGLLAFYLSSSIPFAQATQASLPLQEEEGPRLIQTAEGRFWMTQPEIAELARRSHESGQCGGFMDVTDHPSKTRAYNKLPHVLDNRVPTHQTQVQPLLPELSAQNIFANIQRLSQFQNRYCKADSGAEAARWIRDQFVRLARGRTDVTTDLFTHRRYVQPSVVARIAGRGPHANERIILGAHEDSINWSNYSPSVRDRAPGADDDASGVATLLETFRVLMDSGYRPDRTIEFMTYAGEEIGLVGSQDIAEQYKQQGVKVAAVLQMDMTMYPGSDPKLHMISDHVDRQLTRFTEMLIDTYVHVPWEEMPCQYACSDHASWTDAGYASAFPFEATMGGDNPKIHTADDLPELLQPTFGLHFAKLTLAFAIELASE